MKITYVFRLARPSDNYLGWLSPVAIRYFSDKEPSKQSNIATLKGEIKDMVKELFDVFDVTYPEDTQYIMEELDVYSHHELIDYNKTYVVTTFEVEDD